MATPADPFEWPPPELPALRGATGRARRGVGPLRTAAFAAWRELRAGGLLVVLLPALMALAIPMRHEVAVAWFAVLALFVAPAVLVLAAARGDARADAFWRGLGGPSWARVLGSVVVHAVTLGGPSVLLLAVLFLSDTLVTELFGGGSQLPDLGMSAEALAFLSGTLLYPLLYLSVRAARAHTSGLRLAIGPLVTAALLLSSLWIGEVWLQSWGHAAELGSRLVLTLAVLLLCVFRWESRLGVWGAAVRRSHPWRLASGLGLLWLLSWGVEAAWAFGAPPPGYLPVALSPDGEAAYYSNRETRAWGGRAWVVHGDGSGRRLPGAWVEWLDPGPAGAVLVGRGGLRLGEHTTTLRTSAGEARSAARCVGDMAWRADGGAVACPDADELQSLALIEVGSATRTIPALRWPLWVGGRLLGVREGRLVDALSGEDLGIEGVRGFWSSQESGWVLAGDDEQQRVLWLSADGAVHTVGSPGRWRFLLGGAGVACSRGGAALWTCWDAAGVKIYESEWYSVALDSAHVWLPYLAEVIDLVDGHRWSVASPPGESRFHVSTPVVVGDRVRFATSRGFYEVAADGARSRL